MDCMCKGMDGWNGGGRVVIAGEQQRQVIPFKRTVWSSYESKKLSVAISWGNETK